MTPHIKTWRTLSLRSQVRKKENTEKKKEKKPVGHDAAHKDVAHVVVEVASKKKTKYRERKKKKNRSAMTPHIKTWRTLSLRSSESFSEVPV